MVPDGSQFTRYIGVISGQIKNQAGLFVCGSLQVWVAREPAFLHHLWGKQNYQPLFVFRPQTEFVIFSPILIIIPQFCTE